MNKAETQSVHLARVAKAKRPVYLDERAVDNLYSIVFTMMQENAVMRDRLDTVERLLEERGVMARSDVESFVPDADANAEREGRNAATIEKLLRCLQEDRLQFDDSVREGS
jgi:hypothetical protein